MGIRADNLSQGPWHGKIDSVRVYADSLKQSQIKDQYYAGLNKLYASNQITKKEYFSRLGNFKLATLNNNLEDDNLIEIGGDIVKSKMQLMPELLQNEGLKVLEY